LEITNHTAKFAQKPVGSNITVIDMEMPVTIIGSLLCFYLYYYFASQFLVKKFLHETGSEANQVRIFLFRKFSGFVFMGILPLLYYRIFISGTVVSDFGLRFSDFGKNVLSIAGLSFFIALFIFLVSKIKGPVRDKPQIRVRHWTTNLFLINSLGWIVYLVGYETLFRGVLLITCYHYSGFWTAIAINLAIYSAVHMVNGTGEAIGALVFGLAACLLTLLTGTIFFSISMHIVLALSTDYFAIKFNPDLQCVKNRTKTPKI